MEGQSLGAESNEGARKFGQNVAATVSAEQDLSMSRSAAVVVKAGRDLNVSYAGSAAMVAGGNSTITNGGAELMVIGGNADLTNGGAQTMIVGGNATFKKSLVFAVISKSVTLEEGSRVLLDTQRALLFGLAAGAVMGLMSLLRHKGR